jgi:GT2 family glycosyltransferase
MIVLGSSITAPDVYRRCAEPGFERIAEPDTEVIGNAAAGSLARSYNLIMSQVAQRDDLDALVLAHQDAEIVDPEFLRKVRHALADPEVGVVGLVGAIDVRSIAWWEGSVTWASFTHRYDEFGGGEIRAFTWGHEEFPGYARTGEVDTLDGFVLALSPWVVRNIRFDESLPQIHGYDLDFCLQVREAGRKVMTIDSKAVHHHSLELVNDPAVWIDAHMKLADKWEGRMPGIGHPNWGAAAGDWKQRARHAEAQAGAAQLELVSTKMQAEARERQLSEQLDEVLTSTSWRLTKPLRELSLALRKRLNGGLRSPERP